MLKHRFTRLSFRQARDTVLVAICLSLIATAFEHVVFIERERAAAERQAREVVSLVAPTAAKAAYILDNDLAGEVLNGLLVFSPIFEARINDELGDTLAYRSRPRDVGDAYGMLSETLFGKEVAFSTPLTLDNDRRRPAAMVGTLTVSIDTRSVTREYAGRVWWTLSSGLLGNLILGAALLLLFRRSVTRPLLSVARDLAIVDPRDPSGHRVVTPENHEKTEIGFLVRGFNDLLGRYDVILRQRDAMMEDLIGARRRAEDASRAKSQFLTTISHELRTPLNAIIGFSQIIRDDLKGTPRTAVHADFASEIHSSGEHLLSVINDIIDFSNLETGRFDHNPETIELKAVFDSCRRLITPRVDAAGLNLVCEDPPADCPRIHADPRAVKQILMHLLSNAVKFTRIGGSVTLSVARDEGGGVAVSVADTGIGIDPTDLSRIFQPFWQAAPVLSRAHEGTGLGLTMVKSLADLNRARIAVDSVPNRGTRFTVVFPADPGRIAPASPVGARADVLSKPEV